MHQGEAIMEEECYDECYDEQAAADEAAYQEMVESQAYEEQQMKEVDESEDADIENLLKKWESDAKVDPISSSLKFEMLHGDGKHLMREIDELNGVDVRTANAILDALESGVITLNKAFTKKEFNGIIEREKIINTDKSERRSTHLKLDQNE